MWLRVIRSSKWTWIGVWKHIAPRIGTMHFPLALLFFIPFTILFYCFLWLENLSQFYFMKPSRHGLLMAELWNSAILIFKVSLNSSETVISYFKTNFLVNVCHKSLELMHSKREKMYTRINFISHSGGEKKFIPTRTKKKPVILQSSPSVQFCQHQWFSSEFPWVRRRS